MSFVTKLTGAWFFYPDNNFQEGSKYKIWAIDFLSVVLYHININKQNGGNER